MDRRRRIQIIDVVGGFEALTHYCQYRGVLQVRLRDLRKDVSGILYRQAALADNSQQGICGFRLMMLGLPQRLQFLPCAILPPGLRFFENVLLKGRNSFGRDNFGWEVGHWAFAQFKIRMLVNSGDDLVSAWYRDSQVTEFGGLVRAVPVSTDNAPIALILTMLADRERGRRVIAPVEMRHVFTAQV
jgi:hypothetical protein